MKLLFDQNLSWRLPKKVFDLYPDSLHVREAGMRESEDVDIWEYAKSNGFVIVTKDEDLLRRHSDLIKKFEQDAGKSYLALP